MQVAVRGNVVHLIRSTYQRLDKANGTGGRSRPQSIAKFAADEVEIPLQILQHLTSEEDIARVMAKAIYPARERAADAALAAEVAAEVAAETAKARERDPMPRIDSALQFLHEAVDLAMIPNNALPVDYAKIDAAIQSSVIIGLRLSGSDTITAGPVEGVLLSLTAALRLVASRIADSDFPVMTDGIRKENTLTNAWRDLEGATEALRSALQVKRYLKARRPKEKAISSV